jgi:cell division protein FtsB
MIDFYEKRKLQGILYSRTFLVLLCIPVGFLTYVAWHAYTTAQETRERRLELAAELARLEDRTTTLEQDIANLDDPRGVEAALRKRYEVGKAGEELIVLVDDQKPTEQEVLPVHQPTLWDKIKGWF